jgi:hypothetical protein
MISVTYNGCRKDTDSIGVASNGLGLYPLAQLIIPDSVFLEVIFAGGEVNVRRGTWAVRHQLHFMDPFDTGQDGSVLFFHLTQDLSLWWVLANTGGLEGDTVQFDYIFCSKDGGCRVL